LYQLVRGLEVGDGRILESEEEAAIQEAKQDHCPEEYGIDSALWTRGAVQSLIEQMCGVALPIRMVGEYLKRWGYTPKRPQKRADEQASKAVEEWLETAYPQIQVLVPPSGIKRLKAL
jgi:transposase